jgi:GT2 family glycosyltransferase
MDEKIFSFSCVDFAYYIRGIGFLLEGWCFPQPENKLTLQVSVEKEIVKKVSEEEFIYFYRKDIVSHLNVKGVYTYDNNSFGFFAFVPCKKNDEHAALQIGRIYSLDNIKISILPVKTISYLDLITLVFSKYKEEEIDCIFSKKISNFFIKVQNELMYNYKPIELQFGTLRKKPSVSVVVPCFPDMRLSELQLASFVAHLDCNISIDLIYVVNNSYFDYDYADYLHLVYGIPFRVMYLADNYGYAIANNIASLYAESNDLVFLNSDIFLMNSSFNGFLADEACTFNGTVTGVKLFYLNGMIQHGGLFVKKIRQFNPTTNTLESIFVGDHFSKGLVDNSFYGGEVDGVTGAVLRIDRDFFKSIGLFSTNYIMGDYEDIDLCLKAKDGGGSICYRDDISAYHAEGYAKKSLPPIFSLFQLHNRNVFNNAFKEQLLNVKSS